MAKIRNIGIFAHVDAGKTSLTENMLFASGAIKSLGSVDDGTTQSDQMEVEKKRGISVRSSLNSFEWKGYKINLVDTPGHVDFSADVERVLQVIDGAVLVISAIDGVQSHTDTIWQALKERNIPCILFVNKIDRPGVYLEGMLEELSAELTENFIPFQRVSNEGTSDVEITPIEIKESPSSVEKIANVDDSILGLFLEEKEIPENLLQDALKKRIAKVEFFPLLFGSAKLQLGINHLLEIILEHLPPPIITENEQVSALIYSLTHQDKIGKTAFVRMFQGQLKVRDLVQNHSKGIEEKITQLNIPSAGGNEMVETVSAGDIVGIIGLNESSTGDVLGKISAQIPDSISLNTSLLTVQVKAKEDKDYADLAHALQMLSVEDPSLEFEWYREEKEMHVKVMGWIQIEVLEQIILQRFGIVAIFEDPTVIYKETPITSGYGLGHYTMPKPCWAIVRFLIEPGERGSGVQYESKIRTSDVHQKYQNEVERSIPRALKQGIKGWEVIDIKITLVQGEDHQMHSRPGNFVLATPMGIMLALEETGTKFLEPILAFKITASDELLGKLTAEILRMRGQFNSPQIANNKMILTGTVPVAESLQFPVQLASLSGGKAKMNLRFHSYAECPAEYCKTREFKGISPLDRSKYILKMRKAVD